MGAFRSIFLITFALVFGSSHADPDLLQDICVADLSSGVKMNGFPCKNTKTIGADDFFFAGFAQPSIPNNTVGSLVTAANVEKIPGELEVGFLTTSNKLISKVIKKGEIFVFPKGLVHFQKNIGWTPAAVVTAFNSQFPGTQSIAATLFAASPTILNDVLSKAFQINTSEVEKIKLKLKPKK
ncbi:hypothetical protein GOBAR_DD29791 [Gossypium barbadense]|nr:hypothetical protein GOBAR_DD29791 [Gossypium barbadense]